MKDEEKTKAQLTKELETLRQRIAQLEVAESERNLGNWIRENVDHTGGGNRKSVLGDQTPIHDLPTGISRYKSHVWQAEASVGEAEFEQIIP